MANEIYIDTMNGSDTTGQGTQNNPYKTLQYFCDNVAVKTNADYIIYLQNGSYEITGSTIFGQFTSGNIVIVGRGEKTEILQKVGMYTNTNGGGNKNFTLTIARLKYNISKKLSSSNLNDTLWNWNFYNVLLEYTPDNGHSIFYPLGGSKITFRNCVKLTSSTSMLRTTEGLIEVYDSIGYFTSGYSTNQTQWDKGDNTIGSTGNYVGFLHRGQYAWNINKTLILQDGKYKKFIPKTLGKDSTVNVVPNMTSDTSPIGKATARGAYDPAWKAFDRNDSTYWYDNGSSAGAPSWLQYQFDTPKIVNKITLSSLPISGSTYGLKEFSFLGSYDGLSYDNLLTVDNHPNNNAKVTYVFNNSKEYLFYKLQFGLSYYSYYTLVNSFEMYEIDTPDTPAYWSTISNNIPSSTQFLDRGMDNISPLFDRTITKLEPLSMTNKSELLQTGEIGKTFSKVIDLKKYFDIRSIRTEVK